jgi:hypothetical protein
MNDINVVTILSAGAFVLEINMFYGASGRDKQCLGYPDCFFYGISCSNKCTGASSNP